MRKGEKYPGRSEIEPETVAYKQWEALYVLTVYFVERTGELQYVARLSLLSGAVAKASLNRAFSYML